MPSGGQVGRIAPVIHIQLSVIFCIIVHSQCSPNGGKLCRLVGKWAALLQLFTFNYPSFFVL